MGVNNRYSYVATPLEMTPPTHGDPRQDQTYSSPPPIVDNEKRRLAEQELQTPDIQQHPAIHAPFADPPQPETGPEHNIHYPSSPGPLPAKMDPYPQAQEHRNQSLPVAPDADPLQSPSIPYFPPPVRSATAPLPATGFPSDHQPGQISHPNQQIRGGGWNYGLCDCSSLGTCCLGLLCPCILYGRTQHRLSMRSRREDPTNMLGYETCNGSCTGMALLCGFQWLLATIQHTRTRKAYAIQGSIASDCVRATCCTCCTLIQDEKEIRKREEERTSALRAAGAALVSPYLAPAPMSYGSPQR
ncbi:PLAC8 family-domain-containing protein [Aspergillus unguis]